MSSIEPSTESDITVLSRTRISSSPNNEKFHDKDALHIGAKVGEFEIRGHIGRGGFGIVYLAFDHSLHREVALKEYMPDEFAIRGSNAKIIIKSERHKEAFQIGLRSFVNEARLLAHFKHPSLAEIHRFWEENDTAYIAMEYCQGKTFKEKLSELDNFPDEVWLKEMLSHLLDALDILHRENCLHRDISPDNILFRPNGQPILIDFGAARYVKNNTQPPTIILRPGYAPIEQYGDKEEMTQGPWTDIYALAAVIYFAIAEKIPRRKTSDQLKPLSESDKKNQYSRKFLNAIDRALSDKPENRPQSVEEFRIMLGLTENSISPEPQNSKKNRFGMILTIVALLIATAVFLFPINTPPSLPPESYNPIKVLDEIYQNRDPTHIVNVAIEKEVLRIGKDLLRLKISSTRPGYVYIFVIGTDRDSSFYRIFLSEDKENYINTTSPLEAEYEMMGPPGESHYIVIVSEYKRDLNNLNSKLVTIGNPICPKSLLTTCVDSYGAAQFSIEEIKAKD